MIKTLIISTIALFVNVSIYAQDYVINLQTVKSAASLERNDLSGMKMNFSLNSIYGKTVVSNEGESFTELYFGKGYAKGEIGTPKLPAFKRLIQIPHGSEAELNVVGYTQSSINLKDYGIDNLIYPNQPSPSKADDLENLPFHFTKEAYRKEGFSNEPIARIEILGTLRGVRIARVEVSPVDYDPVNGKLQIYNDIEVDIRFANVDRSVNESIRKKTYSPFFEPVYQALANPVSKGVYEEHPDLLKYPVKMIILSHRMFEQTLQPYILWKTQKGFNVEVVYTDVIGGTSQNIKNFLYEKYNSATEEDPAPTFLVLVGDVQQLPASEVGSSSKKMTDLYYASVDGDYFPEMYYGRLSAQTTTQLENIINKIIYYEKYQFADPQYLDNVTLIAGADYTWNPNVGQPTVKYGTKYHFNSQNGFNTVWGYGVGNDPNNPNNSSGYSGCYDKERIEVSLINYTAHCNENRWADPFLGISGVNAMTNTNKYPLAIGNCCLSADFGYSSESLGEAWIRAENKGAVTYIGSSPNSFWFEDFYWSVGAFPIVGQNGGYVPTFEETTLGVYDAVRYGNYLTTGGLVFVGNLSVTEVDIQSYPSHSSPLYYWQAYNILGDPSLMPYFKQGKDNVLTHSSVIYMGFSKFTVNALPGSYVAVSKDGVLLGTALINETGHTTFDIDPIIEPGDVDLVVTRPKTIPYITKVPAVVYEGLLPLLESYSVNDETGNSNSLPDYAETFSLNVTLKNVGGTDGNNISAILTGEDQYFSVVSTNSANFGTIENGASSTVNNAFVLQLADNVPNEYTASFELQITDGSEEWTSILVISALAPNLEIGDLGIDDNGQGIPNVLDPGETANVIIKISNIGSSSTPAGQAILSTLSSNLTVNGDNTIYIPAIEPNTTIDAVFSITASSNIPLESEEQLNLVVVAGSYSQEKELTFLVGKIPEFFMGTHSEVISCMGKFFDSGGASSNYASLENSSITFYPTSNGQALKFEFIEFSTESNFDFLYIYNGTNTSAPQFPGSPFSGTNGPGIIVAANTDGAITFRFTSDNSYTSSGWIANFECFEISSAPECTQLISPEHLTEVHYNPLQLNWELVNGAFEYDIYIGKETLPTEPTLTTSENFATFNIDDYSNYVWKVVPSNNYGSADGCPTWNFNTNLLLNVVLMHSGTVEVCNGILYDSGGDQSNYSNFENHTLTILPTEPGKKIRLSFEEFAMENNWDFLSIFNGLTDNTVDLMAKLTGTSIPVDFVASNEHGALTLKFTSDYSNTLSGWKAYVSCETSTDVPTLGNTIRVYPNPFNEFFTVNGITQAVNVSVYNALGSIVYSATHNKIDELTIPTKHFAKGVYIITLTYINGERVQRKLIKQ
jgi:hypothetical protein